MTKKEKKMKIFTFVVTLLLVVASIACTISVSASAAWIRNVSCVARPNQDPQALNNAVDWACSGGGVNCAPIQPGGSAYYPNTLEAHASWVFNQYYQQSGSAGQDNIATCFFGGTAMLQCPRNSGSGRVRGVRGEGNFQQQQERIIGVNIGGWLVLEPWITPSLFQQFDGQPLDRVAIDEFTFNQVLGPVEAKKQLTRHWQTWITEKDMMKIKASGFTHIRVPFGSWLFGDQPPFIGNVQYLDNIVAWAEKYEIKVLLDLHGAVFTTTDPPVVSQNGFDNSGRACVLQDPTKECYIPTCPKQPTWGTPAAPNSVNVTIALIQRVVTRYKSSPAIWGFELLNEPRLINKTVLRDFYRRGYEAVREIVGDAWWVVIHDGFYPLDWIGFMTPAQGYVNVILDTHQYEAFGGNANIPYENHLIEACGMTINVDFMQCNELPLIVGEWSLASTDCAKWLDGFGQNASSTLCPQRPPNDPYNATFLKDYGERQLSAWYRSEGFFFWTWKNENTEGAEVWNIQTCMQNGWLPSSFVNGISKEVINKCNYSNVV